MKTLKRAIIGIMVFTISLGVFLYFSQHASAMPAERDDFIILGRESEDIEGETMLLEEKITLRSSPNINSPEQGRLESGASVRVLDKVQLEGKTFYFVMKIGAGGGLSGWVSEEYIYEILPGQPQE